MKTSHTNLMTQGSVTKNLLCFTLPLLLGNLFQQLYNTADSIIVGKIVGKEALAAVTSSGSLIFLLNSLFLGIALGAGVVISGDLGSKNYDDMSKTVHTTLAAALVSCAILTVLGVLLTPSILRLMGTPDDVFPRSVSYFRIYFAGISTTILYNFGSGILRAVGDSKRPLYYLIASVCTNILLDLLLVPGMGVSGAALATVISQGVSCTLVLYRLFTDQEVYRVRFGQIRIYKKQLSEIIRIGMPSGIQNCLVSLSNVVIQSSINSFGTIAMAGCGAYFKVEGFALMPAGSFGMTLSTFVSQNLGANRPDRAKKGAVIGVLLSCAMATLIGILMVIFAPYLIRMFIDEDPAVVEYGVRQMRLESWFYAFLAFSHAIAGVLRGAGHSKVPMYTMAICWCGLRVTVMPLILHYFHNITVLYATYPCTWFISALVLLIYFLRSDWTGERATKKTKKRSSIPEKASV
ncbi:MAG: MATE family efflux transporter [Eubacteriales bacterium]